MAAISWKTFTRISKSRLDATFILNPPICPQASLILCNINYPVYMYSLLSCKIFKEMQPFYLVHLSPLLDTKYYSVNICWMNSWIKIHASYTNQRVQIDINGCLLLPAFTSPNLAQSSLLKSFQNVSKYMHKWSGAIITIHL